MAYDPYKEQGERRTIQTVAIEAPSDVRGAMAQAQGLQALGQGLGDAREAVEARNYLLADTDARKAVEARTAARNDYFYAPEKGLMNTRGANGVNIRDGGRESLTKIDERFAPKDPLAAKKYWQQVDNARLDENKAIDQHSSAQTEAYILEGRTASINTALENAVLNFNNPELFDKHINTALAEQRGAAALTGLSPQGLAEKEREIVSNANKARILRTAVSDPLAAKALLDGSRDRLSPDAQQALDTALDGPVTQAQANAALSEYIGTPGQVRPNDGQRVLPRGPSVKGAQFEYQMGPNRPNKPSGQILDVIGAAAVDVLGEGARVVVTSGTEDSGKQYGSNRHKTGLAADVAVYDPAGNKLRSDDPRAVRLARAAARHGATGIGFGSEYMGGDHFHIDLVGTDGGGGNVWGSGAKAHSGDIVGEMGGGGAFTEAARRAPGQAKLSEAGLPVTPLTEFIINRHPPEVGTAIVGALGKAPGTLMKTVDPTFEGDPLTTVAMYADRATRELGADSGSQAGRYMDTDAAVEAALAQPDPKVRDAMLTQITRFDALNTKAKDAAADAAYDQAWTDWKVSGNSQIPLETQLAMGPGKLSSLQATIKSAETGSEKTDMDVYETLMAATSDPSRMAGVNLRDYRSTLTEADYRFFVAQQAAATTALGNAGKAEDTARAKARIVDYDKAWEDTKFVFEAAGLVTAGAKQTEDQKQRALQARRAFNDKLGEFTEKEGRAPNTLEMQSLAADMTVPVVIKGTGFWGSLPGMGEKKQIWETEYVGGASTVSVKTKITDIPVTQRLAIGAEIEAEGGEPSPEAILAEHTRRQLAKRGLPVAATETDVPEWARAKMAAAGVSPGQFVVLYNGYMAKEYGD